MEKLKPEISKNEVKSLVKQYYGLIIEEIDELNGYDDCNFYCKINDQEKGLIEMNFKVTNHKDTEEVNLLESLNDLSLYIYENGINVPIPIQNLKGNYLERIELKKGSKRRNAIRLFTFITGILFQKVDYEPKLLKDCGCKFALLNKVLTNYSNKTIDERSFPWALENVVEIREYLDELDDLDKKNIVEKILDDFKREVMDKKENFTQAIIHDDLNDQNLIVRKESNTSDYELVAILDFNDVVRSIRIFDIAIFCAYCMLNDKCSLNFIEMPKYILKAYCENIEVTDKELNIIPIIIKARLCQSLVLGNHFYRLDPTNEYVLDTSKTGWSVLRELQKFSNDKLIKMWL